MESEKQNIPIIPNSIEINQLPQNLPAGVKLPADFRSNFIEYYRRCFPNLKQALGAMGLSRQAFYDLRKRDAGFDEAIREIQEEKADAVEAVGLERAMTPGGFLDRISFLKMARPEKWNPTNKVSVEHTISDDVARLRHDTLRTVIDAEPLPNPPPLPTPSDQI